MDLGDLETTVKVIVVGNGGVGKSSMTARYCKGVFTDTYKKTIGVDFLEKNIVVDEAGGESVKLMIWDTAGQEEFDALTAGYYRGAGACAIVFSTIDRASFEALDKWKRKVEDEIGPGVPMVIVQNKTDLADEAAMTSGEAEAAARRLGLRLYRSCVRDNINVAEVFEYLAAQHILGGGDSGGQSAISAAADLVPGTAGAGPVLDSRGNSPAKLQEAGGASPSTSATASSPQQDSKDEDSQRAQEQAAPVVPVAAPKPAPVQADARTGGSIKLGAPSASRPAKKKSAFSMC